MGPEERETSRSREKRQSPDALLPRSPTENKTEQEIIVALTSAHSAAHIHTQSFIYAILNKKTDDPNSDSSSGEASAGNIINPKFSPKHPSACEYDTDGCVNVAHTNPTAECCDELY